MAEQVRFTQWDGGMNSQDEPYLLPENVYVLGQNIVLESAVPQSRLGSTDPATAYNSGVSSNPVRGTGEYLYYDTEGVLSRYLLNIQDGDIDVLKWNGSTWLLEGTSTTTFTSSEWCVITNFNNKAIITNGVDQPQELDAEFSESDTNPLGVQAPKRRHVICDFAVDEADDAGYATQAFTYGTGSQIETNELGVQQWEIKERGLRSNQSCLKLTVTDSGTPVYETLEYASGSELDLSQFHDGKTSDKYDLIAFAAHFVSFDYLESLTVEIDFDDGTFTGEYVSYELKRAELDAQDWIGKGGGRYRIMIPKYWFEAHMQNANPNWTGAWDSGTDSIDWSVVRGIRFTATKASDYEASTTVIAYIDYLRLLESPPIPRPTEKLISSFNPNTTWDAPGVVGAGFSASQKTYGLTSLKVPTNSSWILLEEDFNDIDLAHWHNDVPIRNTDCIAFDLYCSGGASAYAFALTLRIWSGTRCVGITKQFEDAAIGGWTARKMPGIVIEDSWVTVYVPMSWIKEVTYGEFDASNHDDQGDHDMQLDGWTAEQVLSKVDKIQMLYFFPTMGGTPFDLYIDHLRITPFPLWKTVCTFTGVRIEEEIPLTGMWNAVEGVVSQIPVVRGLWTAANWIGITLPQSYQIDVNLGEPWSISGCEWEYDYETKMSLISSLKMKIEKGGSANALLDWSDAPWSYTRNFTEFGADNDTVAYYKKRVGTDITLDFDGVPSDDNDVFEMRVMVDRLAALDKMVVVFNCGAGSGTDYYSYEITPEILAGTRKVREIESKAGIIDKGKEMVGGDKEYDVPRNKVDHNWIKVKMRKSDFARYGTDGTASWANITHMNIIIMAQRESALKIRLDRFVMRNEGALEGEYRYKTIYRTKDAQSAPTEASPPVTAHGSDVILESIPVSNDTRVLYKDIYRMGGGNQDYRYVDTLLNSDEVYIDNNRDDELMEVLDPDHEQPPICKYGWIFGNRYWLANSNVRRSRIYYSRPFIASSFPTNNFIDIEPSAYGEVTGGVSRDNDIIIFKRNAIYRVVEGQSKGDTIFWFHDITKTVGCDSPRTICSFNNEVYWLWQGKPYRLVGTQVDDQFGEVVKPTFLYSSSDAFAKYHEGRILFSIRGASGSTENDKIITYNIRLQAWEGEHFGTGWSANSLVTTYDNSLLSGSSEDGQIHRLYDGTDDQGTDIEAKVRTRYITGFEKKLEGHEFWVTSIKSGSGNDITIQPVLDYTTDNTLGDDFTLSDSESPQINRIRIRGEDIGTYLGFDISCSTDSGVWKLLMAILEYVEEVQN